MSSGLDPFVDGQGDVSYFMTPTLRQRIDLVRHLLSFGRQIVVLTGVSGSGKSALLAQITNSNAENWQVLNFTAGPTLNHSAILRRVCVELELDEGGDDSELLSRVQGRIEQLHDSGESLLIAIDDADGLPADAAECLVQLAHAAEESLEAKILLSIDPNNSGIIEQLQSDNVSQALLHVVEVPQLSDEQTKAMLTHRWQAAYGDNAALPLGDTELAQIVQQASGLPGRAIVLARQIQILAKNADHPKHDPAKRYLLGGVALIVVFALFAFFNAKPRNEGKSTQIDLELPGELVSTEAPALNTTVEVENALEEPRSTMLPPAPLDPPPATAVPEVLLDVVSAEPPASVAAVAEPEDEMQESPATTLRNDEIPAQITIEAEQKSPIAVDPVAETPPLVANPPAPAKKQPPKTPSNEYSLEWLKKQPAAGYVLQLFGVRDQTAARKFIKSHNIGNKSAIFTTTHAGAPWYVVVYGYFPSRDAARAAIDDLPDDLARLKPWAKPLKSIE